MSWPLDRPLHTLLWTADGVHDLTDGRHHARFEDWCAEHAGSACGVRISGAVLLDLLPEPGTPAQTAAARLQWAQRIHAHYHGPESAAWPLAAWPAAGGGALGVSAWPGADPDAMRASARRHGVRLRVLAPLWPVLLQRLLQARPALARAPHALALWVEGGSVGIATLQRGRLVGLQRRRLPAMAAVRVAGADGADGADGAGNGAGVGTGEDTAAATGAPAGAAPLEGTMATLQRLVAETLQGARWPVATVWLGPGAPAPTQAVGLDLAVVLPLSELAATLRRPAEFRPLRPKLPRVDFMQPLPQPGPLAWAVCAACVTLLATAALEASAAFKLRKAALALASAASKPLPTAVASRPSEVRRAESALWLAQAAHPWAQVMLASERASLPGVTWQSLEHVAGGDLRLQGHSVQPGQARAVAAALRRQGPWNEVWVVRQEVSDSSDGSDDRARQTGENFEIVARGAAQPP